MTDVAALAARIDKLEHELAIQQDIHQIRRVQYSYGYFIDKSQYNEVVDLFSDEGEVWFLGGIYKGKAGVRRLYIERFQTQFTQGHNGPRYGREDGVWKIKALRYFPFWHGSFEDGWAKTPIDFIPMAKTCFPQDPLGPDSLITPQPRLWPATDTVEFHYPHPVTGKPIVLDNSRAREGYRD